MENRLIKDGIEERTKDTGNISIEFSRGFNCTWAANLEAFENQILSSMDWRDKDTVVFVEIVYSSSLWSSAIELYLS